MTGSVHILRKHQQCDKELHETHVVDLNKAVLYATTSTFHPLPHLMCLFVRINLKLALNNR